MDAAFIRPRFLTLITTHQCTAACDHCCFACSPKVTARIERSRIASLIDEALAIPSIRFVSFTGGECFLLGDELDEHFAHCTAVGLQPITTTNGYWAVNAAAAARRMRRAADAGLTTISFSTGTMHARFVPVERIVHGAVAACEQGLETSISIETFAASDFDQSTITDHPQLAALIRDGRLRTFLRDWMPHADGIGSSALRPDPNRSRFGVGAEHYGCNVVLDDLTVTPSLSLAACCGHPIESIPDLHLGSLANGTLAQVIAAAPEQALHLWLHLAGPERMLLAVKEAYPEYELPIEAVHPCQVCLYLHRDPIAFAFLRSRAEMYEGPLRALYDERSRRRMASV